MKLVVVFVAVTLFALAHASYTPVVMMHGIGADHTSMNGVVKWITDALPGVYVKNVEIGNGYWDSYLMNLNDQVGCLSCLFAAEMERSVDFCFVAQVASFCAQLASDPNLIGRKINVIGYSQGIE
jgi:predicted esterase